MEVSMSEKQVVLEVGNKEITEASGSASPKISRISPKRESFNRSVSRFGSSSGAPVMRSPGRAPVMQSPGRAKEMEEEEETCIEWIVKWIVNKKVLIEWIVFVCLVGVLVASFTLDKLDNLTVWGLKLWKWCVLAMVVFRGMLVTNWFMQLIVFVTRSNFWLRNKMLYYVHGMKKSVQVFMWLGLVLLTWLLLCDRGIERSKTSTKIFHYVTTRESIFHQYVLQTLSGPPVIEMVERSPSFRKTTKAKGRDEKDDIDMGKLLKMKLEEVSARTMEVLVDAVSSSAGLSTFSYTDLDDELGEQKSKEIASEMEATAAARHIFWNVAQPGSKYIEAEDLMRFLIKEEVDLAFMLIDEAETGRIKKRALKDWVVKVYNAHKGLIHSLTDTKKAVKQLDRLVTSILIVIGIVVWLLLVEIATTKVLVFLSSQIVLAAFIFGNTCKNIFEAVVFVFVMHPFHVGDRCVVDGVPLIVEEMNILTTVFSKLNKDKVYYPNSVLSTLPISNCKGNSDTGDVVEFSIAFASVDKIYGLKEGIKRYFDAKPQYWHPNHNVAVIGIENGNTLKMALYFDYYLKPQNFGVDQNESGEKTMRRSELVIELVRIMEYLNIRCFVLPPQSSSNMNYCFA
ncbi:hypothetical protein M0R45_000681 [Rubus argutus]|uniref:Mechanosensitive ion channel MscS domain-containing protein n=1 Tax=Rubus argutus TaxID=59490 RepID=A0AAW1VMK3_RUBAR